MERSISFLSIAGLQILGPASIAILVALLLGCVIFSSYRRKQRKAKEETTKPLSHMRFESMDEITVRRRFSDEE